MKLVQRTRKPRLGAPPALEKTCIQSCRNLLNKERIAEWLVLKCSCSQLGMHCFYGHIHSSIWELSPWLRVLCQGERQWGECEGSKISVSREVSSFCRLPDSQTTGSALSFRYLQTAIGPEKGAGSVANKHRLITFHCAASGITDAETPQRVFHAGNPALSWTCWGASVSWTMLQLQEFVLLPMQLWSQQSTYQSAFVCSWDTTTKFISALCWIHSLNEWQIWVTLGIAAEIGMEILWPKLVHDFMIYGYKCEI